MKNAGQLDIQIDQGATFTLPFQVLDEDDDPVSLSGATISGKIRRSPESTTVIATFTGTVTDGPEGEGQVSLSAATTAAIAADSSGNGNRKLTTFVYDIEVTYSDLTVQRILEGNCYLSPEATR
jgi:hypothetical protein